MITIITHRSQAYNPATNTYGNEIQDVRLLSTDTKPTDIANGSTCIEIDTGKAYLFNADGGSWEELPEGSSITINPASGVSF